MIPVKPSNTKTSSIVAMGQRLIAAMRTTGKEYLLLNRGVNSVVNIELNEVVKEINFNSDAIQVYPGAKGKLNLRNSINTEYFSNQADAENILITSGGSSGLDICFQNLDIDSVLLPTYHWGTYRQMLKLRNIKYSTYNNLDTLVATKEIKNKAVIICDPGNPLGEKTDDKVLLNTISQLDKLGVVVIIDSPYRRLFFDKNDTFYTQLLQFNHVIIIESFSKSLGLSGQRIGFIHSTDSAFTKEASLRILYATNGVNGFAQLLVNNLLSTTKGQIAVNNFKKKTCTDIALNINYLKANKLLASEFYKETNAVGIFCIVNKSSEELFENRIGSVGLDYFVDHEDGEIDGFSRILVAIPHEKFVSFFRSLI